MGDWIAFWDSEPPIYVSARHREAHYGQIAQDIAALIPAGAAVLDYGCGEALHAETIAVTASRLTLCEAAPKVRAALSARFRGAEPPPLRGRGKNIDVRAPAELVDLPARSLDAVVMHSVAQYLGVAELDRLLLLFRRLLKDGGLLIIGDIIPPHVGAVTDAVALIRFAAANGFLLAAISGLARTLASDYWRLRSRLGLTRYSEKAMVERLVRAGFSAHRAPANIGHNPARMTFLARRLSGS